MIEAPVRSNYTLPYASDQFPQGFLSPSSIVDFLRCGECFYLARIVRVPRPRSIHLPIGSAVHRALEIARHSSHMGHDSKISLRGIEEAIEAGSGIFDKEVTQPVNEETGEAEAILEIDLKKYASIGKAKDHAVALARFAIPRIMELDRSRGKVVSTEYDLSNLRSPYPFPIRGRIDALYVDWLAEANPERADKMADTKTSAKVVGPDEYTALAQTVYEEHWSTRGLPLVVVADVISKNIYKGQYRPELTSYPLTIDADSRALAHQTVLDVAEDVSAGRFRPRPNFLCSYIHGWPEFQVAVSGFAEAEE